MTSQSNYSKKQNSESNYLLQNKSTSRILRSKNIYDNKYDC